MKCEKLPGGRQRACRSFKVVKEEPGIVPRTLLFKKERHREAHHRVELEFHQPYMKFAPIGTWTQPRGRGLQSAMAGTRNSSLQFGSDFMEN